MHALRATASISGCLVSRLPKDAIISLDALLDSTPYCDVTLVRVKINRADEEGVQLYVRHGKSHGVQPVSRRTL